MVHLNRLKNIIAIGFAFQLLLPSTLMANEKKTVLDRSDPVEQMDEFDIDDLADIELPSTQAIETIKEDKALPANFDFEDRWWSNFNDIFEQKISGAIGTYNTYGDEGSTTNIHFFKIRYEDRYKNVKFYLEALKPLIDIQLSQDLELEDDAQVEEPIDNLTLGYSDNSVFIRDAYIDVELGSRMTLTLGRKVITWGQFDPISAINLVFPINYTPVDFVASKVALTLPKDTIALSLFPTENIAITAYYFPTLNFHPIFQEGEINANIDTFLALELKDDGKGGQIASPVEQAVESNIPSGADAAQYALRTVFYLNRTTIGLSFYRGYDVNRINSFSALDTLLIPIDNSTGTTRFNQLVPFENEVTGINDLKAIGFELSTYIDNWQFIVELSYSNGLRSARTLPFSSPDILEFIEFVQNENDGKLFVDTKEVFAGIGVNKSFEKWDLSFALFGNYQKLSGKGEKLFELEEAAFKSSSEDDFVVYPIFNIERFLGENKDSSVGFSGGALGYGYGVNLYYNTTINESINAGISFRYIEFILDDILTPNEIDDNFDNKTRTAKTIALNFSYVF